MVLEQEIGLEVTSYLPAEITPPSRGFSSVGVEALDKAGSSASDASEGKAESGEGKG